MLIVHGIPTCDTVRKARKWLDARDLAHQFNDLRKDPPTADQLSGWVDTLGSKAMRNTSGRSYRALPDAKKQWSDAEWVEAFAGDPMLLKRPLIVRDGQALLAGFRGTDEALADALGV